MEYLNNDPSKFDNDNIEIQAAESICDDNSLNQVKNASDICGAGSYNINESQPEASVETAPAMDDFPFLSDERSVDQVKRLKVMFIMRGLPGSGKSMIVERIKSRYESAASCSADDFFLDSDGMYKFSEDQLSSAHESCRQRCIDLVASNTRTLIIDNTNIRRREMKAYMRIAKEHGYVTVVVTPNTEWRLNPLRLAELNKHGVTLESLERKLDLYREVYPMYWGWFFNDTGDHQGDSLTSLAERYFKLCLQYLPGFYRYMRYHVKGSEDISFDSVYSANQPPTPGRQLHCTAFYAGPDGKDRPEVRAYADRDAVKKSMGKSFELKIVAINFTPRTAGARVLLDDVELELWGGDTDVACVSGKERRKLKKKKNPVEIGNHLSNDDECKLDKMGNAVVGEAECQTSARTHRKEQRDIFETEEGLLTFMSEPVSDDWMIVNVESSNLQVAGHGRAEENCDLQRGTKEENLLAGVAMSNFTEANNENVSGCSNFPASSASPQTTSSYSFEVKPGVNPTDSKPAVAAVELGNECKRIPALETAGSNMHSEIDKHSEKQDAHIDNIIDDSNPDEVDSDSSSDSSEESDDCETAYVAMPTRACVDYVGSDGLALPYGSRSHITLGCAAGIPAVQTGPDQLNILLCAERHEIVDEPFHIDGVCLTYYDEGRCSVYFDGGPRSVNAVFTGQF